MADSKKNVFFIGGYSYTVDKSTPLCRREDFFHSATLYQSPNGRFFVVENDAADTITVKVLSKSDAKTFMVAKRIKWEICRYYERNGYTIRVPAFMKRRFRECLKKQQQLENTLSRKVSIEAALRELGLSDSIIAGTMAAFHRMKTTSIEAGIECSGEDSDASLLDFLSSDTDMENTVISQEWHKELHRILFEALADIPGEQCSLIVRHYFNGRTFRQLAEEYHTTPQTLYNWKEAAFRSIRTGKYGKALAEFSSSESGKRRADSLIKQDLNALKRLELSNKEKELLAL